ncbi:MAG: reprolysin-like metallopeptidase [Pyrinomonadaceae bacterium]
MSSLKRILLLLPLVIATSIFLQLGPRRPSIAQEPDKGSPEKVWTRVAELAFEIDTVKSKPTKFKAFNLDASKLAEILRQTPSEFTTDARDRAVMMLLPLPTGDFGRFRIEESPIIQPKLAERYPWLKAYSAKGVDDRTATGRLEVTPEGLTGMVISASGVFIIDPASKEDPRKYISYFKANLPRDPSEFVCHVDKQRPKPPQPRTYPKKKQHHALSADGDSNLRIYRIAVAAAHEYVDAIHQSSPSGPGGDPLTQAIIAIHRTIDRVNVVYESELGVRLELIGDEPSIIYPTAATDPYNASAPLGDLLDANQSNIDDVIGWNNYDVGHLFLAHGGGLSSEPCVCDDWYKANGVSGRAQPEGNVFDVDYVAHELGHQFGAHHSFNGTTRGCKSRRADTAYEPGSGSTIMGYASGTRICGDENVQDQSDPYFHAISLREINSFITNPSPQMGDSCSRKVATTNLSNPVVIGPGDYVIPKGTPFTLSINSGSDNDGDALVYNWEEFDRAVDPDPPVPGGPLEEEKIRPLFRSRRATGLSRTFPQLVDLLNKPPVGTYTAESLPMNNRTMVFRASGRDSRGRYGFAESRIRVVANRKVRGRGPKTRLLPVGPFVVTQPAQAASWRRLSRHTVSWNVRNTNVAPVSCHNVTISLLINGKENNPIVLAAKVPNNGSANVIVPGNTPLGNARVKVEAFGNIFFNLADVDVQIVRR